MDMAWNGLTEDQWAKIAPHLPKAKIGKKGGRPWADDRSCFEGILWILWTGAPWSEVPKKFASPSTCWRRLQAWEEDGTLLELWRAFLGELEDEDKIKWDECFIDGTFASAKKGASRSERQNGGREQSLWFWSMARVLRSEFTWTRHPRRRSNSSKKRSPRSRSSVQAQDVHALVQ
jgi:transposase